jgi:lysophospholipase L1-like esterase
MTETGTTPLSLKQQLLLGVGIPSLFFAVMEVITRCVIALSGPSGADHTMQLEMPTWMMQDANAFTRATPTQDALEWLNMFEQGRGYRVRLKPNISLSVKNTFSLISTDRDRRYLVSSNSLGFRSPEIPLTRREDTFRVAIFGDSSSFGWGVNVEDSWASLLRQNLQSKLPNRSVEVMNFAIPGDSSAYGSLLFEKFAPQARPDLVILGFGANDAKPVFTSHTSQVARFKETSSLQGLASLFRYSALYRALENLAQRAQKSAPADRPRTPAVSPADYAANLSRMASSAKEMGAHDTLLLTLCTPNNYAKRARGVARSNGLLWLNGQKELLKAIPEIARGEIYPEYVKAMQERYPNDLKTNSLFYVSSDGCHPNELGHRLVAEKLASIVMTVASK